MKAPERDLYVYACAEAAKQLSLIIGWLENGLKWWNGLWNLK